jgi:hypothetical protein
MAVVPANYMSHMWTTNEKETGMGFNAGAVSAASRAVRDAGIDRCDRVDGALRLRNSIWRWTPWAQS